MVENRGPPELVRPAPGPAPPRGIQVLPLEVLASEHIPGRPHKPAQREVLLQIADGGSFLAILVERKSSGRYGGRLLLPDLRQHLPFWNDRTMLVKQILVSDVNSLSGNMSNRY